MEDLKILHIICKNIASMLDDIICIYVKMYVISGLTDR